MRITAKQVKQLARQLRQASVPYVRDPLCVRYKINVADLKVGCRCPACGHVGMTRKFAEWACVRCGKCSRDAHKAALFEYAHMVSDSITIAEAMEFLGVGNRSLARRLLISTKAKRIGNTHQSKYILRK